MGIILGLVMIRLPTIQVKIYSTIWILFKIDTIFLATSKILETSSWLLEDWRAEFSGLFFFFLSIFSFLKNFWNWFFFFLRSISPLSLSFSDSEEVSLEEELDLLAKSYKQG